MTIEEIIANTIHDTVADITGYEEETSSAVIAALACHGYHINRIEPSQIAAVIRKELSLDDWRGDHLYEGTIDPDELADAIADRLR